MSITTLQLPSNVSSNSLSSSVTHSAVNELRNHIQYRIYSYGETNQNGILILSELQFKFANLLVLEKTA